MCVHSVIIASWLAACLNLAIHSLINIHADDIASSIQDADRTVTHTSPPVTTGKELIKTVK